MSDDDFFADLNKEIATAIAKSKRVSAAKKARKAANNMRASTEERRIAKSEWLAISKELEAEQWRDEAIFTMFSEQSCDGCGSTHRTFLQYMLQQVLIRKPSTQRFVIITKPVCSLPREVMVQPLTTHICADCCHEHDFDLTSPVRKVVSLPGTMTVSGNYVQDEIDEEDEVDAQT